jgi:hypothetical protein
MIPVRLTAFVFALSFFVAFASRAEAADGAEADRLIAEGIELRRKHQDLEALERFRRAHALAPSARTQGQIGFAEQALGRWVEAERDLRAALDTRDPWAEKNRAAIERALLLADERLGTLRVEGSPAGAAVRVDGAEAGSLPITESLRVSAGTVTVEVTAPGHAPTQRTVPIVARKLHLERVVLIKLAAVPRVDAGLTPAVATRALGPHQPRLWVTGWTMLGLGAGLVGLGGAGVGVRESAAAEFNGSGCVGNALTRADNCSPAYDRAFLGERLSISGFVVGGALVLAAVGLLTADSVQRRRAR